MGTGMERPYAFRKSLAVITGGKRKQFLKHAQWQQYIHCNQQSNMVILAQKCDINVCNFISFTDWNITGFLKMISPLKAVSDIEGQLAFLPLSLMTIKIWAVSGTTRTYESQ